MNAHEFLIENTKISIFQGDLTEFTADALVNAANNRLWMGGGVAGALKRKGGRSIEDEALKMGPIPVGEAAVTKAGKLNAKFVIHAAGMGTDLKTDPKKIKDATYNSLKRAVEVQIRSIAFPSIGTGVGGFPVESAAEIMLKTTVDFLKSNQETILESITFVLYDAKTYQAFYDELERIKRLMNL